MNKGNGKINNFKNSGQDNNFNLKRTNVKSIKESEVENLVEKEREEHIIKGEFSSKDRLKNGGHGEENIEYMKAMSIPYEINIEYNNGVRVGNILDSTQSKFKSGNKHTWFPKEWTREKIIRATNVVASKFEGIPKPRDSITGIYEGIRMTVIFGENGKVSTSYPNKEQDGGIKHENR